MSLLINESHANPTTPLWANTPPPMIGYQLDTNTVSLEPNQSNSIASFSVPDVFGKNDIFMFTTNVIITYNAPVGSAGNLRVEASFDVDEYYYNSSANVSVSEDQGITRKVTVSMIGSITPAGTLTPQPNRIMNINLYNETGAVLEDINVDFGNTYFTAVPNKGFSGIFNVI